MPGFYDPCLSEEKQLEINYQYHNQPHRILVEDTDPVWLPKQGKLIPKHWSTKIFKCLLADSRGYVGLKTKFNF